MPWPVPMIPRFTQYLVGKENLISITGIYFRINISVLNQNPLNEYLWKIRHLLTQKKEPTKSKRQKRRAIKTIIHNSKIKSGFSYMLIYHRLNLNHDYITWIPACITWIPGLHEKRAGFQGIICTGNKHVWRYLLWITLITRPSFEWTR